MAIHRTHRVIRMPLKHMMLFSLDKIEKALHVPQRDENRDLAAMARLYTFSIEEI
jgi:hypothetical protein